MTRVTVERLEEKGIKRWSRTSLSLDLVTGVIEIQQRGFLGRKKPPLIFRAGELTGFDVVMVSDPLEHFYAAILLGAMLAGLNLTGWSTDGSGWEFGRILLDLAAVGLAFLLASWIKVPAIRLERPVSQPSPPSHDDNLDLASLKGRDPKEIIKDPAFRRVLSERLVKSMARQPARALRDIVSMADKDPARALEQLSAIGAPTHDWVHIVSTWNGLTGTRSLAAQIADVLTSHRYRGIFPHFADDAHWRTARLRRLVGIGLVIVILVSTAATMIFPLVKNIWPESF